MFWAGFWTGVAVALVVIVALVAVGSLLAEGIEDSHGVPVRDPWLEEFPEGQPPSQ